MLAGRSKTELPNRRGAAECTGNRGPFPSAGVIPCASVLMCNEMYLQRELNKTSIELSSSFHHCFLLER